MLHERPLGAVQVASRGAVVAPRFPRLGGLAFPPDGRDSCPDHGAIGSESLHGLSGTAAFCEARMPEAVAAALIPTATFALARCSQRDYPVCSLLRSRFVGACSICVWRVRVLWFGTNGSLARIRRVPATCPHRCCVGAATQRRAGVCARGSNRQIQCLHRVLGSARSLLLDLGTVKKALVYSAAGNQVIRPSVPLANSSALFCSSAGPLDAGALLTGVNDIFNGIMLCQDTPWPCRARIPIGTVEAPSTLLCWL